MEGTPPPAASTDPALGLIYIHRARWQKCHHWDCGEGKAKKIKGISDEMLICFRKQVGALGLEGFVRLRQGWRRQNGWQRLAWIRSGSFPSFYLSFEICKACVLRGVS